MKKKITALLIVICVACSAVILAACDINSEIDVTGITLDCDKITLTVGENVVITTTITPIDATNQSLQWTSSNPSVAAADDARIDAIAAGEATITVTTANGKTASCVVTVVEKQEDPEPTLQHTVTFDANGGKFTNDNETYVIKVNDNSTLTSVTASRGDKYVLTGWYTQTYHGERYMWDFETDTVNDDTTLYASWKYLNDYQSVIDALSSRIKTERDDGDTDVTILTIYAKDGYLCFAEKDDTGVFAYATDINGFDTVKGNAEIIAAIPTAALTEINDYNDVYTSDSDAYIADCMAGKYTRAANMNDAIIYSCVSEWEEHSINSSGTGVNYSCNVKAIIADEKGNVYNCSFIVISGVKNFNAVIGGSALSVEDEMSKIALGEIANDFYAEYIKEIEA